MIFASFEGTQGVGTDRCMTLKSGGLDLNSGGLDLKKGGLDSKSGGLALNLSQDSGF